MADIRPFRALRYNQQKVTAVQVVTQPYDKITRAMQEKYYAASPFNLVRIILGRSAPDDNTKDNVYTRAATFSRTWREQGILQQDADPSIYPYSQTFLSPSGKKFERVVEDNWGSESNPLSASDVRQKFRDNARLVLDDGKIDKLLSMADRLEDVRDINDVVALCVKS